MMQYRIEKQNCDQSSTLDSSAASAVGVGAMSSISRRLRFSRRSKKYTTFHNGQRCCKYQGHKYKYEYKYQTLKYKYK